MQKEEWVKHHQADRRQPTLSAIVVVTRVTTLMTAPNCQSPYAAFARKPETMRKFVKPKPERVKSGEARGAVLLERQVSSMGLVRQSAIW